MKDVVKCLFVDVQMTFSTFKWLLMLRQRFSSFKQHFSTFKRRFSFVGNMFRRWNNIFDVFVCRWNNFFVVFRRLKDHFRRSNVVFIRRRRLHASVKWYKFYLTSRCCYFTIISYHSLKLKNENNNWFSNTKVLLFPRTEPPCERKFFSNSKKKMQKCFLT